MEKIVPRGKSQQYHNFWLEGINMVFFYLKCTVCCFWCTVPDTGRRGVHDIYSSNKQIFLLYPAFNIKLMFHFPDGSENPSPYYIGG